MGVHLGRSFLLVMFMLSSFSFCFAGGQLLGQATPAAVNQATSMFKLLGTSAGTLASNIKQEAKAVTDSGLLPRAGLARPVHAASTGLGACWA